MANPCGNQTPHTNRISCCAECKNLFSSDSAFQKHRRQLACVEPSEAGLLPRPSRSHPEETIWALPQRGEVPWGRRI